MFGKKDIKPGMLVELLVNKEKVLYYVTSCKEGIVLLDEKGCYGNLNSFNDNLSLNSSGIKINKVYDLCEYAPFSLDFSIEGRELLWSREDQIN